MTIEEIDDCLAVWHSKLNISSQNLIAIDDLFTFRRLNGEGGLSAPTLTGETARRVPAAVASIAKLWEYQQMLCAIVDRAEKLRKSMPNLFGADKVRQQITDMLQGASIDFPAIETPLAERGLLTSTKEAASVTPLQLMQIMSNTFEASKTIIMQVDEAWNRLESQLAALNTEADKLQSAAAAAGEPNIPEMETIRRRIADLTGVISTDPLGAGIDAQQELIPLMQRVRGRVQESAALHAKTVDNLSIAHRMISDLEALQGRTTRACEQLQTRVEMQSAKLKMLDPTVVAELESWLNTLQASYDAGNWRPVCVGIERWLASGGAALNTVKAALDTANTMMEAASELKGRLLVQRTRAESAMRRGTTVPESICAIEDEAERMLKMKPVPLDRVQLLVQDYEKKIGALL